MEFSGTAIYANLWAVMHDKYYWKDPNEFRPERFLDNDGQFRRDDRCVPFSLGKRYCIGQVSLNITEFKAIDCKFHENIMTIWFLTEN